MLLVVPVLVAAIAAAAPAPAPARCSSSAPARVKPGSWSAARHAIAPRGPDAVRLCRYAGLRADSPGALVRSVVVTRQRPVRRLVRRLDALPPATGAYSCPNDDGRQVVARFAYPDGHRLTVQVGLSGCAIATNGRVNGLSTRALLRQLERLTASAQAGPE